MNLMTSADARVDYKADFAQDLKFRTMHPAIELMQSQNLLYLFPRIAEHLLTVLPSLWGPTHPKSSKLGLGRVIVEATQTSLKACELLLQTH